MEAKGLRLGNLVSYTVSGNTEYIGEITGLNTSDEGVRAVIDYHYPLSFGKPIPLTPDILSKANLNAIPIVWIDDEYSVDLSFNHVNDQDSNGRDEVWVYFNNARLCIVQYVHQLQNLYYSLTGEELEINL